MRSFARITTLLLFACTNAWVSGQSVQQWILWGDASMARSEFYGASRFYADALELEPGRMSLQWKQAEACRLSNQYDKAADLYEVVYRKDAGRTYPEALRWLGEMQLCDARYDDAERTWNKVLQKEKDKSSTMALRANEAIKGCTLAKQEGDQNILLEHLPEPLNSFSSEFAPRIGPDSVLYFSSLRGDLKSDGEVKDSTTYFTHLFPAKESNGTWTIGDPLLDERQPWKSANATWTRNGKWILYTQCDSANNCVIHYAPFTKTGLLGTPHMGLDGGSSTQPMVVAENDTEWLYFVSDRPGGDGGMDIWRARILNGTAVDPRPLGPPVNSPGNESSPWYDASNGQLWFASDFHAGLGGFDIFHSTWNDTFDAPVNAGMPINSPANDLYPVYNSTTGEGWLTSNRKGSFAAKGETCCNDLYRFAKRVLPTGPFVTVTTLDTSVIASLPTYDPQTVVERLRSAQPLVLYFHNDEPEPRSRATRTKQTYGATFEAYEALFPTYMKENEAPDAIVDFFAQLVRAGRSRLDTLIVDLALALEDGHNVTLDVRGHASPLAQNDYNVDLSRRRIESLRMHLSNANDRALQAYLDSTAANGVILRLRPLPFGEDRSAPGVSDVLSDVKRSVYSVEAAQERRIEIAQITVEPVKEHEFIQRFSIGTVTRGRPEPFDVPVKNESGQTLTLISGNAGCECILVDRLPPPIEPGGTGILRISYSGRSLVGPLDRTITFQTNDLPSRFEIIITGLVQP